MNRLELRVKGLDCAEEVSLLKSVLGKEQGIVDLRFNVLQAKMDVFYDPSVIDSEKITQIVSSTGMKAIPWSEVEKHTIWDQVKRNLYTGIGFLFWLIATITHYLWHASIPELLGGATHNLALHTKMLYLAAIVINLIPIFPKALHSLKHLKPDINLLMVIAIAGAIAIQDWFEAATVALLFSLALLLENWSIHRARKAISSLMELSIPLVRVLDPRTNHLEEKHVEEVPVGTVILVRPGEKIPLDGIILEGSSNVNQLPLTGESMPIAKQEGEEVLAGSINEEGALVCRTTKAHDETVLARIIHLVEEARMHRAPVENWVERFAAIYTPIMLLLALLIVVVPPLFFGHSWNDWIYRGLVFLVIACPCALVISTPVSIVSGLTAAARNGVLIKGGAHLELIGKIQAMALDKTGTLTHGHPTVQKIVPIDGYEVPELLEKAVSLEKSSDHPLARAILKKGEEMGISPPIAENFQVFKGKGAQGKIRGEFFWIGSHRFMHEVGQETEEVHQKALDLEDAGHTVIALGGKDHVWGLISLADNPRDFARDTIESIRELGVKEIVMLTGDNQPTAQALAQAVGVDRYLAELLPEDKVKAINELKKQWKEVMMVGDGINDAPAMAAASLGIAMGGMGSDTAIEVADITLVADDLSKVPWLIRYSRRVVAIIKQNITFSLAVKAIFIILALFNMATLWMAIAADTGATMLVIFNALRLLKR